MSTEATSTTHIKIHGRNYAIPKAFVEDEHPGGADAILDNKGKDATQAYDDAGHSPDTLDMMNKEYTTVTVIYEGVTYYIPVEWAVSKHPGGKMSILKNHGKDITADFKRIGHSEGALKLLLQFTTKEAACAANEAMLLAPASAPAPPAVAAPAPAPQPEAPKGTCPFNCANLSYLALTGAIVVASVVAYKRFSKQ